MATLPSRTTASFDAIKPVSSLTLLDAEFNQLVGAAGMLNGGTTGTKLLVKASDASDPPLEIDQTGAGPLAEWKQNGTLKTSIANSGQIVSAVATGTAPFSVSSTTVVTNLNADTVDGIQGSNIAKLDTHKTAFSFSFGIADPATPAVDQFITGGVTWVCPTGNAVTVTKIQAVYNLQTHTSGGSVTFSIQRRTAAGSWVNPAAIGSVSLNDTNNAPHVVYTTDIADVELTAGDTLICFITARSGTVTERNVSVAVVGTQKLTT